MKCEESPDLSNRNRDLTFLQQITRTPQGKKIGLDDLNLFGLHRDCSPNAYGSSQDKLEIGWGDSPEPLNIKQKPGLCMTPVTCKKRLEAKESPKSHYRSNRSSMSAPAKPPVDVAKYIAEVQELSKKILNEMDGEKQNYFLQEKYEEKENGHISDSVDMDLLDLLNSDDLTNECLIACSQSLESALANNKVHVKQRNKKDRKISCNTPDGSKQYRQSKKEQKIDALGSTHQDSAFEKVLQSFINEEDDWLSQVVLNAEAKITQRKGTFTKTKSENQLTSPSRPGNTDISFKMKSQELRTTFRRTCSFDRFESTQHKTKRPNSNNISNERSDFLSNNFKTKKRLVEKVKTSQEPQRKGFG